MSKNGMTRYIIKRVLYMFLVLFIIMTMCFILIKLLPLPAVREMGRDINLVLAKREKMGYNKPIMVQYFLYLKSILTEWDWGVGEQMYEGMGVWNVMMQKLPYTVLVNLYSILIAIPLGLAFGIYAALKKNKCRITSFPPWSWSSSRCQAMCTPSWCSTSCASSSAGSPCRRQVCHRQAGHCSAGRCSYR